MAFVGVGEALGMRDTFPPKALRWLKAEQQEKRAHQRMIGMYILLKLIQSKVGAAHNELYKDQD